MQKNSVLGKIYDEIKKYEEFVSKNPDSPLLVRLASLYLEIGNVERAITLCNKAVQKYPDYSTAHLLMARCYIEMKAYSKALVELNKVIEILPDSQFVIDLIAKISSRQKKGEQLGKVTRKESAVSFEGELPEIEIPEEVEIEREEFKQQGKEIEEVEEVFDIPLVDETKPQDEVKVETQATYLDELIRRLEEGKSKQKVEDKFESESVKEIKEEEFSYEDISIVTPKLAEILANQGAYEEAIKVYKKLIEQRPYEKEKYEEEIRKLEEKIGK
ncbi:tetratricopeptide repeat protein [Candidatus Chrysopegis kryptomonas]|uniref:Tetratricopeptide repeat-containing protein n=1 Tax=Candidatus Chryseopegocella kryptomonas TaxID=1633643 RepID=A0A0P1MTP6_9BACT|nr:tetratricopeptide repeat protein [Candidatus Chrysopegis kryptomonas]CUS99350.1 Tetratricopeptide repeat-containing protein [Candidatus Chrysopegis kryptomonas]